MKSSNFRRGHSIVDFAISNFQHHTSTIIHHPIPPPKSSAPIIIISAISVPPYPTSYIIHHHIIDHHIICANHKNQRHQRSPYPTSNLPPPTSSTPNPLSLPHVQPPLLQSRKPATGNCIHAPKSFCYSHRLRCT